MPKHSMDPMKLALLALWALALPACTKPTPTGTQGAYLSASYEMGKVTITHGVLVVDSFYQPSSGKMTVLWKIRNDSKQPDSFSWSNKFLIDSGERRFAPAAGRDTPTLQPTQESPLMITTYDLPKGIDTKSLSWGLFSDGKTRYQIKLSPKPDDLCATAVANSLKLAKQEITSEQGQRLLDFVFARHRKRCDEGAWSTELQLCFRSASTPDELHRCQQESRDRGETYFAQ